MKEEVVTGALLRRFLLGKVEDEERQRIESLFLTDSLMNERVLAAEQELIDDYLEDSLSPADRETFVSLYGDTVAQRRKLRIAQSIKEWAVDQPGPAQATSEPALSSLSRLLQRLRLKPVLVIPVAVAAAVAIVVAVVWINSRNERHSQYLALQQELVQSNTPSSLRNVSSVVTVKPGSVRSLDPPPELKKGPADSVAELRLLWTQTEDYPTYEAVLRLPGSDEHYTIPNLTAETANGKFIRLRLPAHRLSHGNYQIELRGVSADGSRSHPEVFVFSIAD